MKYGFIIQLWNHRYFKKTGGQKRPPKTVENYKDATVYSFQQAVKLAEKYHGIVKRDDGSPLPVSRYIQ